MSLSSRSRVVKLPAPEPKPNPARWPAQHESALSRSGPYDQPGRLPILMRTVFAMAT